MASRGIIWRLLYKNKAESLFTSLPPFIIIEDLRIYRVFFTHEGADIFLDDLSDQSKSMSVLYRAQIS